MPPMLAALAPAIIESGVQQTQNKLYNDNRGLPLTVVSLDADLSEPNFQAAKAQIKRDWQEEDSTIAIARAGDIHVDTLGLTQAELQTLSAQEHDQRSDRQHFLWPPYSRRSTHIWEKV